MVKQTYSIVEAREHFSEICEKAAFNKNRFILSRRGKDFVAVIPIEDLRFIEEMEEKRDLELALEALKEARKEGAKAIDEALLKGE